MSDAATSTEAPAAAPAATPIADRPATGGPAHQQHEMRPHTVKTIQHGSVIASPAGREGAEVRTVRSSSQPTARSFTAHQTQMLANLDAHGDVNGAPGAAPAPAETPAADAPAATVTPAAPAPAQPPAAPAATPAPDVELTARATRLADHNKRLLAENEQLRARPASEPDERTKALHEIESNLTTDPMGSIRKLVALHAGIKDPASGDADRLMSGLYALWTSHDLKLPLDPGKAAQIGTEHNRIAIDRDRAAAAAAAKAAEAKTATEAAAARRAEYVRSLDSELSANKHAEKFPLLMKHAQRFDGQTPGELVLNAVTRGMAAGEFAADTPGPTLLNHYSQAIEDHYRNHYQALRDGDAPAATSSTATPAQPTVPTTDNTAGATDKGARAITNASASVAPPAPPAPTSPAKTEPTKPNRTGVRNEERYRKERAEHYFGKGG